MASGTRPRPPSKKPVDPRNNPLLRASRTQPRTAGRLREVRLAAIGVVLAISFAVSAGLIAVFGFAVLREMSDYLTRDLPPVDQVFSSGTFQTAMIYDRKGRLLYELFDPQGGRRTIVPLRDIPPALIDATLSTEDANFYTNPGVDPVAIVRAVGQDLIHGRAESGASTITQQLVRNVLMTPEERQSHSAGRKVEEAILAIRVSERYSKDEILQRYLNEIFYGNLAYGVEAAAQTYFDKPVRQLTLPEAALIAGLPQSPSVYDPYQNPDGAKARQVEVLQLMVKHDYITQDQADTAESEPLQYHQAPQQLEAPHFVMYVRSLLEQRFTREQLYQGGLQIYTTLDLDLQNKAESIAQAQLSTLKKYNANNAALVALDPRNGEILAMLGSVDFNSDAISGQINMALADRQPGSTLKPFNYLYAFDHHLAAPATILNDSPVQFSMGAGKAPYQPHDADLQFRGPVTVRRALANSLNVPAVEMLNQIGVGALISTLHSFGITSIQQPPEYYGLSLTLGGGPVKLTDLVFSYAGLANGGMQVGEAVPSPAAGQSALAPVAILKVTDAQGNVLSSYQPPVGAPLVSPQAAWLVTDILADDAARAETFGQHSYLEIDRPAAVKTGTTEQFQDSWTIGYTPQLVVGVWVGNASDKPMDNVFGARGAGAIWHDFIEAALAGQPALPFTRPSGLVRATVDATTGLKPVAGRPTVTDWFIDGTLPKDSAPLPSPTAALSTATAVPPPPSTATATRVPLPTVVTPVQVSNNPNIVIVPNLVGLAEADAQRIIVQSGLQTTYVNEQKAKDVPDRSFFLSIPVGSVLSQLPVAGTSVPRGTKVYLAVRK